MVRAYTAPLMGSAWSLGWTGADAEDLVQDTFLTYIKNHYKFQHRSSLKTYLIGILYKKSLEKRRGVAREQPADPVDEVFETRFGFGGAWKTMPRGPEDIALANETGELIQECAETLPEAQRLAFYLREVEHQNTEEICNALDVTATHLGVLLFRARNRLRECIQKKWTSRRT